MAFETNSAEAGGALLGSGVRACARAREICAGLRINALSRTPRGRRADPDGRTCKKRRLFPSWARKWVPLRDGAARNEAVAKIPQFPDWQQRRLWEIIHRTRPLQREDFYNHCASGILSA